jgi:hypothetical protein
MAIRPSTPEIITVNSEDLQTAVRDLLPSQNGFGSELQATNVITPIIDLTAAAEGSQTPEFLQRAWDYATDHDTINNTTTTLINQTGFWQVGFTAAWQNNATLAKTLALQINDGLATKEIWQVNHHVSGVSGNLALSDTIIVFLRAGDSLEGFSLNTTATLNVWYRQVASLDGTLTSPLGFSPT